MKLKNITEDQSMKIWQLLYKAGIITVFGELMKARSNPDGKEKLRQSDLNDIKKLKNTIQ